MIDLTGNEDDNSNLMKRAKPDSSEKGDIPQHPIKPEPSCGYQGQGSGDAAGPAPFGQTSSSGIENLDLWLLEI